MAGSGILSLYACCFVGVLAFVALAAGLYVWGRKREARRIADDKRVG